MARETCVYNHNLEKFNEYFVQNLLDQYEDNADAIWYTAPVIYTMFLDMLYNTYNGGLDEIEAAAKAIVNAINPNIGNIESIENFSDSMAELYEVLNGIRTAINDENETEERTRTVGSSLYPVVYRAPAPVDTVFTADIEIGEPQDKAYSGTSEGVTTSPPVKSVTIYLEDWPTSGANRADFYISEGASILADLDITQIVTVFYGQYIPGGTTETPVELPPENVENDGRKGRLFFWHQQ